MNLELTTGKQQNINALYNCALREPFLIGQNYYNLKMRQSKMNRKPIINLFEFANKNLNKNLQAQKKMPFKEPTLKSSSSKSQWTYGLDTLIHFNDSVNLSSIKSHQSYPSKSSNGEAISRYELLITQAKQQAQKMKNRRIDAQMEWKNLKQKYKEQDEDRSMDESEVNPYDLDSSQYPTINQYKYKKIHIEDKFIEQIRQQIVESNVRKLTLVIKRVFFTNILRDIKIIVQMKNLSLLMNNNKLKQAFTCWKEFADYSLQRKMIRTAIVARIKQRRAQKDEDQYIKSSIQ